MSTGELSHVLGVQEYADEIGGDSEDIFPLFDSGSHIEVNELGDAECLSLRPLFRGAEAVHLPQRFKSREQLGSSSVRQHQQGSNL